MALSGAKNVLLVAIIASAFLINEVRPHGRLIEPPSRSTMWRYGFNTPPNYNDHELYCGGFSRQWGTNGGKCGICGDPWDSKQPRANEAGGMFGKGIIVRKYEINQAIKVRVELTANHMGYFEFRICPNNNPAKPASQMCLDENVLRQTSGAGTRFYPGPGNKVIEMHYQLPKDLTCKQCVFQWRYVAGNNWGRCENGTEAVGCGPQEEFRACADVTITTSDGSADETINTLVDPEIYVPKAHDYEEYNEVDYGDLVEDSEAKIVAVESVVIIVLASLLVTVLFFASLFFYYTRGKVYIEKYVKDMDLPTMPSLPKIPKKLTSAFNWPLSNVQIKNLPMFLQHKMEVNSKPNIDIARRPLPARPPQPPPRSKRPLDGTSRPLRAGAVASRGPQRPNVPPPAVPTLEIGEPTSVTINGVTVTKSRPEASHVTSGPPSVTGGSFIVPATPAMANEDIPDSMQSVPPPPPSNPPPPLEDEP